MKEFNLFCVSFKLPVPMQEFFFAFEIKLYSWGHLTTMFLKILYIMGYNVKKCQKWKEHIENTKMAKFEAPGIKEQVNTSISIFRKFRGSQWKILPESKVLLSDKNFHTNLLVFLFTFKPVIL